MLKRFTRIAAALAIVTLLTAGSLAKAEIVVQNAGFESAITTGWTQITTESGAIVNNGTVLNAVSNAEGNNIAYLDAHWNYSTVVYGGLYQALSSNYTVGESYKLTVSVAAADYVSGLGYTTPALDHPIDTMEIRLYWDNAGTKTIINSSQPIVFGGLSTSSLTDYSVTIPTVQIGDLYQGKAIGVWFQTTFKNMVDNWPTNQVDGWNTYWLVDNVRVTATAAPEPSTIVLLATGLLALLAYAWRRRRK